MIAAIGACVIAAVLAMLLHRRLRGAQFSEAAAFTLTILALLQMSTALTANSLAALCLAAALYFIMASAQLFVEQQSVRNVIVFGGALAFVQTANPLGSLVAAILLPTVVITRYKSAPRAQSGPLFILLLFIPVSTAFVLAYIARTSHIHFPLVLAISPSAFLPNMRWLLPREPRIAGMLHAACLMAIGCPVWFAAARTRTRRTAVIAAVASAVVVAVLLAGLMGRDRPLGLIAPAFSALTAAALCEEPDGKGRTGRATVLSGMAAVFAWIFAVLV